VHLEPDERGNACAGVPKGLRLVNAAGVAYKIRHDRYGKLLIENYGYDLKVKWFTFGP
jgi:hypothetical protein